jgi:hypothetical protein
MTEAEWRNCCEPERMLSCLRGKASDRKLRLFACACVRRVWHLLSDERSRGAVEVAERHADGDIAEGELSRARRRAIARANTLHAPFGQRRAEEVKHAAHAAAEAASEGWDPLRWAAEVAIPAFQCRVLRDLFDPFRATRLDPAWLTREVVTLAEAAYQARHLPSGHLDPARLAVLADALEDAGCQDHELLGHLRGGGDHVRGCWALDLLLGRG